ncbi:MAG: M48 family metalloprotease [Verrucomicrobia bacterium]|nr:M48 family metalloprotease [Verrucomicrobiota bacterium]
MSPLPYHLALRDWLRSHEPEVWRFFAAASSAAAAAEEQRLELLSQAYRLERETHPAVFAEADAAALALGVEVPLELLQVGAPTANAMIFSRPERIMIVFCGPLLDTFNGPELRAVLGHELAHHHLFWNLEGGELHISSELLATAAADPTSDRAFAESAQRWRLCTELFADRGALRCTGDLAGTVGALVKASTGLREVSGAAFLRQAAEVLAKLRPKSERATHPEDVVRARALALWHEQGEAAEEEIARLVFGPETVGELDLLEQAALRAETLRLFDELFAPAWSRSETRLAHAQEFAPAYSPGSDRLAPDALSERSASVRDYFAALLYDFVTCDRELGELPLGQALCVSERLGAAKEFDRLAARELGVRQRDLKERREQAAGLLQRAEQEEIA